MHEAVRSKLSRKVENAFFTVVLGFIYVALFFSDATRDPADSSYLYDRFFFSLYVFFLFFS